MNLILTFMQYINRYLFNIDSINFAFILLI